MQAAGHDKPYGIGSIVPALAKNARTGHPQFQNGKGKRGKLGHPPAGYAQVAAGTSSPGWGNWHSGPPYGDDPADQAQIIAGYQYYQNGCYK
jgi:hypothetical protein